MNINREEMIALEQKINLGKMPYAVIIELTNYCNLHCKMCMNSSMKRTKGFMDENLYKKIINELSEKCPNVSLWLNGMGEPTLHKSLPDWIRYAKGSGLTNVSVNTNATLINEELAEKLVASGLDQLVCGVDAYDKQTYESIRTGADRDSVYKNIDYLLEIAKRKPENNLKIEVQQIEMQDNIDEQIKFMDYWRGRGAYLKIIPYQTWLGWGENQWTNNKDRIACSKINMFQIFWDGTVPLCGCDYDARSTIGNIYNDTIENLWNTMIEKMGHLHIEHRFDELPDWCQKCTDWIMHESKIYNPEGVLIK